MSILKLTLASLLLCGWMAMAQQPAGKAQKPTPTPTPTPTPRPLESFAQKLLRIFGLTVTPSALKGEDDELRGDVWLTDLQSGAARRLTYDGGYRSPLLTPGARAVLALKGETVVEIPVAGGKPQERFSIPGIVKLAGMDETGRQIALLRKDGERRMAVELLAPADGKRTALPYDAASDADARMLAYLLGWDRSYDGGKIKLYTQSDPEHEQRNVYLEEAGTATNISHCNDSPCGQPALALKARSVVFIKARPRQ